MTVQVVLNLLAMQSFIPWEAVISGDNIGSKQSIFKICRSRKAEQSKKKLQHNSKLTSVLPFPCLSHCVGTDKGPFFQITKLRKTG